MQYFETEFIKYINDELFIEEVPLKKLADDYGTPLYVYSRNHFKKQYNDFTSVFKNVNHKIFYAMKANFNLSVINTFVQLGSGVDVNSEGELYRALKTGVEPRNIILTGVGKTKNEIKLGILRDLLLIKAESEEEVELIDKIAGELGRVARVAIRVNPDVDPKTHPYISTGLANSKFGVNTKTAWNLYTRRNEFKHIKFTGIDMHIGSQITSLEPFAEAVRKLAEIYFELKKEGLKLEHFDVGGGIGVRYRDENPFTIQEYADALIPCFEKLDCEIFFEPGRYLTANGGILLTEVIYNFSNGDKRFIIVDAAMNDLLRPTIYHAYHHIQPVKRDESKDKIVADIVGPICETGDYFAKDREIYQSKTGELLAIMSSGAYGMVMSSNYNGRRRPPEILVDREKIYVTRSRETFDYMLYDEKIV
jgi:diaminopimelate decarboxylase